MAPTLFHVSLTCKAEIGEKNPNSISVVQRKERPEKVLMVDSRFDVNYCYCLSTSEYQLPNNGTPQKPKPIDCVTPSAKIVNMLVFPL